jgi:hypothetical protein
MGQIYQVTKQLSDRKAQVNMPIKDKNNNILTIEREQYLRWMEHFQEVLNQKNLDEFAIIPEAHIDLEIDTDPPLKTRNKENSFFLTIFNYFRQILVAFKYFVQSDWLIIVQNLELPYNVKLKTQVVTDRVPSGFMWDSCCSIFFSV